MLRDPYALDFLGLKDAYQERDLEEAILREMERCILELGSGFAFLARQKRLTLDGEDFYMDLLFYYRDLRRLVVVELKLDRFRPEHKGQMALYLRWPDKCERKAGEDPPIGIILCTGKDRGRIELLELDKTGIYVAEYLTVSRARPREPLRVTGARMELQEGAAIAAGTVTEIGAFAQRTGRPRRLAPRDQQIVELLRRQRGEAVPTKPCIAARESTHAATRRREAFPASPTSVGARDCRDCSRSVARAALPFSHRAAAND